MSNSDSKFAGSIPEIYDTFLVPLIFEHYAADLAGRIAALSPGTVLETAAGSGVVTRALAPLLGGDATYTVTDLNQPMLDRAQQRQPADNRLSWRQADALALPFDDDSFDAACCQFGVMFFPDRTAGFREALRVLKPGGQFIFNVWDRIEENVFADVVTAAAATHFPADPPRFLARTPHGYFDPLQIQSELQAAGFADIEIEFVSAISTAASHRDPAIAYCQGTPLRNEIEQRDSQALGAVTETAANAIFERFGQGPVAAKIQALTVTASRPY